MKDVKPTKNPSVRQILNMASNLHEKFNKPANVEIKAWRFSSEGSLSANRAIYRLYVENRFSSDFEDWPSCQNKYFSIMDCPVDYFPPEVAE